MSETARAERGGSAQRARLGTVLVPTDFSSDSIQALEYAKALLQTFEGSLHLVHVQEPDYAQALPALMEGPALLSMGEIERHYRARLQQLCALFAGSDATPPCHARKGRAFDEICKTAREIGAELIVIATRGLTGVKHLLLGSTAERVVRYSPCPVLVVRQGAKAGAMTPAQITRILAPVDFSDRSRAGVERAILFAEASGASVTLVHAIHVAPFTPTEHVAQHEHAPAPGVIERAAKLRLSAFVKTIDFRGVRHEAVVRCGRPADEICDFADEIRADLIVISTHGHTGLAHVLIGSVAEHVVRYARSPVLVVPQRG